MDSRIIPYIFFGVVILLNFGILLFAQNNVAEIREQELKIAVLSGFSIGMIFQEEGNAMKKSDVFNITNITDNNHPGLKAEFLKCIESAQKTNGTMNMISALPCTDFAYNITQIAISERG